MSFAELADRFVADLERAGATVILEGPIVDKPARIRVIASDRTTECLLFLWNITPGGGGAGVRPRLERRIQVTAATRFPIEPGRQTFVGGWSEEAGAWGFWNVMRHTRFSLKSPSAQITKSTLEFAFHHGVATQKRKTRPPEIVVAVAPAFLLWYVEQGRMLHASEDDYAQVSELVNATPEDEREFVDSSGDEAQATRRIRMVEIMRAYRAARFRPGVLRAYSHQCAACTISLNLVDAAHIIPVRHAGSTDEITNGIALCRLHHAAFDNGLIGFRPDYRIVENPRTIGRLTELNFMRGIEEFRASLLPRLRHPSSLEVRPNPEYLRRGMEVRNFAADLIG